MMMPTNETLGTVTPVNTTPKVTLPAKTSVPRPKFRGAQVYVVPAKRQGSISTHFKDVPLSPRSAEFHQELERLTASKAATLQLP